MNTTTIKAIAAVLEGDCTVSPPDRKAFLRILRNGETTPPPPPPRSLGIIKPAAAAERLSCTVRSIHNLAKQGLLTKIRYDGRTRASGILSSSLDRLIQQ